jgi:hypothetical protein
MLNGWMVPGLGIFVVMQASAAIWWASATDTQVEKNTSAIERVIDNEKQIAIIQVQQSAMQDDVVEIKDDNKELKQMTQEILGKVNDLSKD